MEKKLCLIRFQLEECNPIPLPTFLIPELDWVAIFSFDVIFYGVIKQLHCVLSIHNHVTSRDY